MTVEAIGVAYPPFDSSGAGPAEEILVGYSITQAFDTCRLLAALRCRRVAEERHLVGHTPAMPSARIRLAASGRQRCQPFGGMGAGYFRRFLSIFDSRAAARSTSRTVASDSR